MAGMADKTYAVDRITDGTALCECIETGIRLTVDIAHLPPDTKEGDLIRREGAGFMIDKAQTEARHQQMRDRLSGLLDKGK